MKYNIIIILLLAFSCWGYAKTPKKEAVLTDSITAIQAHNADAKTKEQKQTKESKKKEKKEKKEKNKSKDKKSKKNKDSKKDDALKNHNDSLQALVDSLMHENATLLDKNRNLQEELDKTLANLTQVNTNYSELEKEIDKQALEYEQKVIHSARMEKLARDKWLAIIIMQSPIHIRYDSTYNAQILHSIDVLGYEKSFPDDYKRYHPLLSNYKAYNQELYLLLENIYSTLKKRPTANKTVLNNDFESAFAQSNYYKVSGLNKEKNNDATIYYLDKIITEARTLFSDPSKCTAENFAKLIKKVN